MASENQLAELKEKAAELKRKIADAPAERERELKMAEADLEKSSKIIEKSREKFDSHSEVGIAAIVLFLESCDSL